MMRSHRRPTPVSGATTGKNTRTAPASHPTSPRDIGATVGSGMAMNDKVSDFVRQAAVKHNRLLLPMSYRPAIRFARGRYPLHMPSLTSYPPSVHTSVFSEALDESSDGTENCMRKRKSQRRFLVVAQMESDTIPIRLC